MISNTSKMMVVNPDNEIVEIDPSEFKKAEEMGYRFPTDQDIEIHNYLQDNKKKQ